MSDHAAFLRAIRAAPDDDLARLALADWLDDHDQPARAEFVRLQMELDPVREQLEVPRVRELRAREKELLAAHRADWLGAAADIDAPVTAFGPVFRRGFPEVVCLPLDTFLKRGEELFAACPTLREAAVYDTGGQIEELAASPLLRHLDTLDIADPEFALNAAESFALVAALRAAGVDRLRIPGRAAPPANYPPLFNALIAGKPDDRPRHLDIVHLVPPTVPPLADRNVRRLARIRARAVNVFDGRFPIAGGDPADVYLGWEEGNPQFGRQLLAGHSGGRPVLLGVKRIRGPLNNPDAFDYALLHAVIFDDDGRKTGEATYPFQACRQTTRTTADKTLGERLAAMLDNLDFVPGAIRVREFDSGEGMSLRLWPALIVEEFQLGASVPIPYFTEAEWRARGGVVRRWLHDGNFVVRWDDKEHGFDGDGQLCGI